MCKASKRLPFPYFDASRLSSVNVPLSSEEALDLTLDLMPNLPEPKPRLVAVIAETTSVQPWIDEYFKGVRTPARRLQCEGCRPETMF